MQVCHAEYLAQFTLVFRVSIVPPPVPITHHIRLPNIASASASGLVSEANTVMKSVQQDLRRAAHSCMFKRNK